MSKFGQREDAVDLATLLDPELVCSVAVHLAINFKIAGSTLFWSRREWQQLVGPHGRIFPVLSTREMVNVQSRLDGTPPIVPAQLMRVINLPGQVIFYQAYTDLPHHHMTDVWRHPVTGNVVSCGCLHPAVQGKLARSARAFIAHIRDIESKIDAGPAALRLEVVAEDCLEDLAPFLCDPATFVDASGLRSLLEEHSFLVPFQETPEMPFLCRIRECLEFLRGELACVCRENGAKGGLIATWRPFQLEIAVETFLWGHPLSPTSATFCSRLGLSPTDQDSATHQRGYLTLKTLPILDAHEDQTPPLSLWVTSFLQRRRIASIVDFEDFLGASSSMIGEKIIHIALKDLYQNSRPPVHSLKAGEDHPPGQVVGTITVDQLIEVYCEQRNFAYPNTVQLVCKRVVNLQQCLRDGFRAMALTYFPHFSFWSKGRHKKLAWRNTNFLRISGTDAQQQLIHRSAALTGDVLVELEQRDLVYGSKVRQLRSQGLPWIFPILRRLGSNTTEDLTRLLTYLTAVALIQSNVYVDFEKLRALQNSRQTTSLFLQRSGILSSKILRHFKGWLLYRLEDDLATPVKFQPSTSTRVQTNDEVEFETEPEEEERLLEEDQEEDQGGEERINILPVSYQRQPKWTEEELLILRGTRGLTHGEAYQRYLRLARQEGLRKRSFASFRRRRQRETVRLLPRSLPK